MAGCPGLGWISRVYTIRLTFASQVIEYHEYGTIGCIYPNYSAEIRCSRFHHPYKTRFESHRGRWPNYRIYSSLRETLLTRFPDIGCFVCYSLVQARLRSPIRAIQGLLHLPNHDHENRLVYYNEDLIVLKRGAMLL